MPILRDKLGQNSNKIRNFVLRSYTGWSICKPFTVITEKNGWYLKFWEIKSRIHGFIQFWIWIALDFEKAMAKSMWLLAILNKNPPNLAFYFENEYSKTLWDTALLDTDLDGTLFWFRSKNFKIHCFTLFFLSLTQVKIWHKATAFMSGVWQFARHWAWYCSDTAYYNHLLNSY